MSGFRGTWREPEDIDIIVLTHLHFDHIGNNELFPNATFIVQRGEVAQGSSPRSTTIRLCRVRVQVVDIRDRVQIIEGDYQWSPECA